MRVIDLENINTAMRNEEQFVLRCEEVFHDKIGSAAATILADKAKKPIVALTGPSGSGKTTTAMRLQQYLENLGVKVCMLSMDNFFLPLNQRPPEAADWESPYCGSREAVIIAEGIHMLNPLIFDQLRSEANGIYVAPRTRIITNDDKIVRPEQLRVVRRMIRDYKTRGHSLQDTVRKAQSVDRGEVNYIQPYKNNAAIHIDSFHDYEPCILAKYLEEIPRFREELTPEFISQYGLTDLMKAVESVPPLHTPYVPLNSIVREFVGGSCFQY